MLSQRLQQFIADYCSPEIEPEYVAEVLRGPGGARYQNWLPRELFAAVQSRELNPETMGDLTGLAIDTQQQVDDWLRTVWPMWFTQPYPGGSLS